MTRPGLDPSQAMRTMLAVQGIFLDEPAAPSPTATSSPSTCEPFDRELVREILVDRGAPAEALDWLVDSCTSVEAAREFVPTPWMRRAIGDDFADCLDDAGSRRRNSARLRRPGGLGRSASAPREGRDAGDGRSGAMTDETKAREFRIPMADDPRDQSWWWDHAYDERTLRLESRKIARERSKRHGVPMPRHVYFVGAKGTDLIKIGSAFDIELRLEELQKMSPLPLRLLSYVLHGGEAMERRLHRMFRTRRSHGEWFHIGIDELRATADALIAEDCAAATRKASPQ